MDKIKIVTNKGEVYKLKIRGDRGWRVLEDFKEILDKYNIKFFMYIKKGLFYRRYYTIRDLEK